jgi:hypothetical protein
LIRESGSFAVFALVSFRFIPDMREQNLRRRSALADPGLSFDGSVVTARESLEPGFSRR